MLYRYEEAIQRFGSRPHWGQINHVSADRVAELYPALGRWKNVRTMLDPDRIFDGPLTRRAGL